MDLICVPISGEELTTWVATGFLAGSRTAHGVTAGLTEAFEPDDSDEAEQLALLVASVAGLIQYGYRLVAVAEVSQVLGRSDEFGTIAVTDLPWKAVRSLFTDADAAPGWQVASQAAKGLTLSQAWQHPAVIELLEGSALLWHDASEWAILVDS